MSFSRELEAGSPLTTNYLPVMTNLNAKLKKKESVKSSSLKRKTPAAASKPAIKRSKHTKSTPV